MITASTPATITQLRSEARDLLNEFDAADGLAVYYALHHNEQRTSLFVNRDANDQPDGFLARCQTGIDLFRPLVTLRVRGTNDPVPKLLAASLIPGRPYLFVVPVPLAERLERFVTFNEPITNLIMRLDPDQYKPDINALVVTRPDPDGQPRAEIVRGDRAMAVAGVNWRSPIFAEIYVRVEPSVRGRGWGVAVVNAVVGELVQRGVIPLYTVQEGNEDSYDLALNVGFVYTGAREVMAEGVLLTE
jgi:GNAT superfamily N-acetyltransferase